MAIVTNKRLDIPSHLIKDVSAWIQEKSFGEDAEPAGVQRQLQEMDPEEFLTGWLEWNGIIGYGSRIWELVQILVNAPVTCDLVGHVVASTALDIVCNHSGEVEELLCDMGYHDILDNMVGIVALGRHTWTTLFQLEQAVQTEFKNQIDR